MTEQERLKYQKVMTDSEREEYKRVSGEALDGELREVKSQDAIMDFLCHKLAKAEYNFNQKIEKDPGAVERAEIEVNNIRERIANFTMYQHGWCYAHEGGGWYELDYEQGDSMGWY